MQAKARLNQRANSAPQGSIDLMTERKIRLAIAEDFIQLQNALINAFKHESDIEIVLIANNGLELLAKLKVVNHLPDIILMDVGMPVMDGIEATGKVADLYPTVKVIAFSAYDNSENIVAMYMHGAKGFVSKEEEVKELMDAIRTIHKGLSYVTNDALVAIQQYLQRIKLTVDQKIPLNIELVNQLSAVELKLLYHTAQFKSLNELAEILHKSPATINNQQANIRQKLGLKGRKSLLQFAVLQLETIKYLLKITK